MKWHEVTWYSKLGAAILFLGVVPSLTFYIGRQYERTIEVFESQPINQAILVPGHKTAPTTTPSTTTPIRTEPKATTTKPQPTTDSGIRGVVMLGPTCPVQRIPPDPACDDKPYATLVAVFKQNDPVHAVALIKSDAAGAFSVTVPPGTYTLGAGESMLPRCAHPEVTVLAHQYATTTISCDTGIR